MLPQGLADQQRSRFVIVRWLGKDLDAKAAEVEHTCLGTRRIE
jgi:hypothetical protein